MAFLLYRTDANPHYPEKGNDAGDSFEWLDTEKEAKVQCDSVNAARGYERFKYVEVPEFATAEEARKYSSYADPDYELDRYVGFSSIAFKGSTGFVIHLHKVVGARRGAFRKFAYQVKNGSIISKRSNVDAS